MWTIPEKMESFSDVPLSGGQYDFQKLSSYQPDDGQLPSVPPRQYERGASPSPPELTRGQTESAGISHDPAGRSDDRACRLMNRQLSEGDKLQPISVGEYNDLKPTSVSEVNTGSYLNRVIRYLGRQRASLEENAGSIGNVVEEFVRNLMQMVGETDPRFTGELLPCGSYYEGVKIKRANEFDYIFELSEASGLCQEHVEIRQKKPESMKPKKNTAVYPRAYYTVNFRAGRVPVAWRCRQCDGCRNVGDYQCLLVKATQVLDLFQNRLVSVTSDYNPDWPTPQITQNGPAVTVYTKLDPIHVDQYLSKKGLEELRKSPGGFVIKIDITLAIPFKLKDESHRIWPLEGVGDDVQLNMNMVGSNGPINKCLLVTSGDYWRASFSHEETAHMYRQTHSMPERRELFQALKLLRDDLALTDDHESGLLSTYPLKVTFMKQTRKHEESKDWDFWHLSERANEILDTLETEGSSGTLTSYFIQNDPVLMESDRSYLESRRLKEYFRKLQQSYNLHGCFHTVSVFIQLFCFSMILGSSCVYLGEFYKFDIELLDDSACRLPSLIAQDEKQALGTYLFVMLPCCFVGLLMALMSILIVVVPLITFTTSNILYKMYRGIIAVQVTFAVVDVILGSFTIRLVVGYHHLYGCSNDAKLVKDLTIATIVFSATVLALLLSHSIIYLMLTRANLRKYRWEWVFADELYKDACTFCCCCTRNIYGRRTDEAAMNKAPMKIQYYAGNSLQDSEVSIENPTYDNV